MAFTWRQFGLVEPIFFVYSYWMMLMFPVVSQYTYLRYSEEVGFPYMNSSQGDGGGCGGEDFAAENSTLKHLENEVQTRSANLFTYYILCGVGPSIIIGPFMGSYADKRGRKPILMLPLIGAILETAINLAIMYFHLPLYLILVGGVLNGISGYFVSLWLALNSYLADTVDKNKLSNRMILLNFCLFFAGTVAQLTSGLWIEYLGFKAPVWFILISLILTLLYTGLFIKESIKKKVKANFFDSKTARKFIRIFTLPRKHGRKNLFLALMIVGTNVTFTVGTAAVAMLFVLRSPICWPPSIVGYFLAYRFFSLGLGSAVFINVLKRCFSEINITRMGFLSQIAGLLMFAFSTKTWMVFLVPAISILSAIQDPVLSSIASRIVSEDEQGMLFAVCGCISAVGEVAGTSLFNTIYPMSLEFFPGFVFVLCAGCSAILLIIMSCFDTSKLDDLNEVNLNDLQDAKEKAIETTQL